MSAPPEPASWHSLGGESPTSLSSARRQAHYALQPLVHLTRLSKRPEADDSHNSFEWDSETRALVASALRAEGITAGLRIEDLTLLYDGQSLPLDGGRPADAQAWLAGQAGIDRGAFDAPLHYELEPFTGDQFELDSLKSAELARYFANATIALAAVDNTSPVRCWPHHFDIAMMIRPASERSIGVGLSPGDAAYNQPYFYVTPWPYPDSAALPALSGGFWHTKDWTGAVALAQQCIQHPSPDAQQRWVEDWLREAISASRKLLA